MDHDTGPLAEPEAIGGALVRRGTTHGIPVPVSARLVEQLHVRGLASIEGV